MKSGKISPLDRITHILEALQSIQSFVEGQSFEEFRKDEKTYFACLFQFAVIGEAIVYIDDRILNSYEYPWYKVRSFRNFIMHEYFAIDEQLVWDTIELDLPGLQQVMKEMLSKEEQRHQLR